MKSSTQSADTFGPDFPGLMAHCVLSLLVPPDRRDEFVGDLIEEAETVIRPRSGPSAARRWFWRQALTSASPLYNRHFRKEVKMNRPRWLVVVLLLVAGPLMAFDPNVFRSSPETITLVVLAILVPMLAGLFSGNIKTLAGAGLCSAVLLLVARVTSGIEIRWYAMAWILFIILALNWFYEHRFKRT